MRWRIVVCGALAYAWACKKDPPPATGAGSSTPVADRVPVVAPPAVADAAPAATDAAAVRELLHAVRSVVRVSSQVANPRIKPVHLVDRDLQTAWNSRTGDLIGAWIDLTVEHAHITELRMTVGHTGKGPRGEDYFTMNPRIARVRVLRDGKQPAVVTLDPDRRDLQVVPVDATDHVRIVIAEIRPGTRRAWREIAVSELEAWGTPSADARASSAGPEVAVGEPQRDDGDDPCAELEADRAEREAKRRADEAECAALATQEERDQCNVDAPGDPECVDEALAIVDAAPPWKTARLRCYVTDNIYGPTSCSVEVATDHGVTTTEDESIESPRALEVEASVEDVIKGPPRELVLRYPREGVDMMVVCRAAPLACSTPRPAAQATATPPSFE